MPTIIELLSARRPQDDEPQAGPGPTLHVLHRVGPGASLDQVATLVEAQRRLGVSAAVETEGGPAGLSPERARHPVDILHVHGAHDDVGLRDRARVVVLGARNGRLKSMCDGTQVIAETDQHAKTLVRSGITDDAVHVVLPPVPADAWRLAGREPARGPGFTVGVLATKDPAGWVRAALDALLPVLTRRLGAELWVGGAAALAATRDWAPALPAPVVRRLDTTGAAAIGRMDVVVCLDQCVTLPPPLLAAMQLRRPIVASRIGGCHEVLDNGVSALLVAPNDTTALVASVTRLVRRPLERATLGGAAAEVAALQHAPCRVAGRLTRLYERLLTAREASNVA